MTETIPMDCSVPEEPDVPPGEFVELLPPDLDEYVIVAPPPGPGSQPDPTPCRNTAHQYAGWMSVYRPLVPTLAMYPEFVGAQFPPHQSDLDALDIAWKHRLKALREAGALALAKTSSLNRALACRPHAFAYAGEGRPCRFWFCPYCSAADAAEVFTRLRKARQYHGHEFGFYMSFARLIVPQTRCSRAVKTLLSRSPATVAQIPGVKVLGEHPLDWGTAHNLVRVSLHPVTRLFTGEEQVEISVQAISAVSSESARRSLADAQENSRRLNAGFRRFCERAAAKNAAHDAGTPYAEERDENLTEEDSGYWSPQYNRGYVIRSTPVSDARAAAHLCRFPAEALTAPVGQAVVILNMSEGLRQSATRGVFRSATAARLPEGRPHYVDVRDGTTLVGPLLPHIPDTSEALAARGFARELGLPSADSFEAIGKEVGWPCYWIGCHEFKPFELFGVKEKSPLSRMVKARRPKRPGKHHILVMSSSIGYLVFWTPSSGDCTGPNGGWDIKRLTTPIMTISGYPLRRIRYHLAPVATFRHLALELRITGPRAVPPTCPSVQPPGSSPEAGAVGNRDTSTEALGTP